MKKLQLFGCLLLFVCSTLYALKKPVKVPEIKEVRMHITLEGRFKIQGDYVISQSMTMKALIDCVGVYQDANMEAVDLERIIQAEETYYLPRKNKHAISLNKATRDQLMSLKGIGEKTADKIIAYRKQTPFTALEDIMKVSGIGEKRYLLYRDALCL